jgi:hypothetical protein
MTDALYNIVADLETAADDLEPHNPEAAQEIRRIYRTILHTANTLTQTDHDDTIESLIWQAHHHGITTDTWTSRSRQGNGPVPIEAIMKHAPQGAKSFTIHDATHWTWTP